MKKYEVLFIINATLAEDARKTLIEKLQSFLKKSKVKEVAIDEWGVKKLAYPIDFKNDGYYVLMTFEANPTVPAELEHMMNLNEQIIRSIIITKEV